MLIAIRGRRGTGKSNFAVYLAKKDKDAGRKIVSTMKSLTFADEYMTLSEIIRTWRDLWDCTIVIDEIQLVADSRRSLSNSNVTMNQFLTQLRKRNLVVIYTTQFFEDLDVRIKRQTDYVYYMDNIFNEFKKKSPDTFYYSLFRREDFTPMPIKEGHFKGSAFWKYYDTEEIQEMDDEIMEESTPKKQKKRKKSDNKVSAIDPESQTETGG